MDVSSSFKSSYVWPNPAFPFRVYLDHPKCRIFIIENIHHNWQWFSEYAKFFRESDVFFVYCGWYVSEGFAKEAEVIFSILDLKKDNFFFMFNSELEKENFEKYGFEGDLVNQNAWLDETLVMRPLDLKKTFRAIYVARRSAFKRHFLAANVEGLALVAGINHGNSISDIPNHVYLNNAPLTQDEVCIKINESNCGLILSEVEGACFSSSEYLLSGIPVVSTPSKGGRDAWYNEYNSIVCEPTPDAVASAVAYFEDNPRDPFVIRDMHIKQAQSYRLRFIEELRKIFYRFNINEIDADDYFKNNFFHKLRKSYTPKFDDIFK